MPWILGHPHLYEEDYTNSVSDTVRIRSLIQPWPLWWIIHRWAPTQIAVSYDRIHIIAPPENVSVRHLGWCFSTSVSQAVLFFQQRMIPPFHTYEYVLLEILHFAYSACWLGTITSKAPSKFELACKVFSKTGSWWNVPFLQNRDQTQVKGLRLPKKGRCLLRATFLDWGRGRTEGP